MKIKLREAIRFKVEQRMEGARKDRHPTHKNGFPGIKMVFQAGPFGTQLTK